MRVAAPALLLAALARAGDMLETVAETPADAQRGDAYVVLTDRSAKEDPYYEAAAELARWRKGQLLTDFDPRNPEAALPRLRELGARTVAIVLPATEIDCNTQRRFLRAAARIDDDLFVDVAYGFVTGTRTTPALAMVERAKALEEKGIARRWVSASVASSIPCTIYPGAGDPTAQRAGFEGRRIYWSVRESDPDVLAFVDREIPGIEGGGVVEFSGCGDPEGIWLFSDRRNLDGTKHWAFDPGKVGSDPAGEMPRITADRLRKLAIGGAVVWNGVCHTGSLSRVFVEGDIVSTFGVVKGHTEYVIPAGRSVAEAILDSGAACYVAPVGPNHGYRNLMEAQEAIEKRLSLGDVLRSTYNDAAIALGSPPAPDLYLPDGGPVDRDAGEIMAGGGMNRVLYGDPALRPFRGVEVEPSVPVEREGDIVRATVRSKDWWAWDMFARDRNAERVRAVVTLRDEDPARIRVTARAWDAKGNPVAAGRVDARIERIDGKRLLHVQVAAPRGSGLDAVGARAEFRLAAAER